MTHTHTRTHHILDENFLLFVFLTLLELCCFTVWRWWLALELAVMDGLIYTTQALEGEDGIIMDKAKTGRVGMAH